MTFQLKKNNTTVNLCDGAEYTGQTGKLIGPLGDSTTNVKWHTVPREYIGAADASPKNMGNRVWEIPLKIGVEFSTLSDAWQFYYSFPASLPVDGAQLVITDDSGNTITYSKAEVAELNLSISGVYIIFDIKIIAGSPTYQALVGE